MQPQATESRQAARCLDLVNNHGYAYPTEDHTTIPQLPSTDVPCKEHPASPTPSCPLAYTVNRFPFNNFRYYLTLFSKFFSSFPHGTCSLSVSRQYLALDGIYHPIRAAFPNNPTRRKHIVRNYTDMNGAITLSGGPFQETLPRLLADNVPLQTTILLQGRF